MKIVALAGRGPADPTIEATPRAAIRNASWTIERTDEKFGLQPLAHSICKEASLLALAWSAAGPRAPRCSKG